MEVDSTVAKTFPIEKENDSANVSFSKICKKAVLSLVLPTLGSSTKTGAFLSLSGDKITFNPTTVAHAAN